ncbi:HEPN domain-containing protein [Bifidobacterium sp.]|jgi:hypothetical protein|uniref:HEPN domain-containing protein n=1 Tax=Bifidobacterium sp. TaxID=41200 RepID=UPI0025BC6333|nr:HEPN domain-containing protein [Bifidobacterium sp.]MCI1636114.1 HEPN domain-containing protein [Bifidobacterium sp.]
MTISDENFQELVQCLGRWALAYFLNCRAEDIDIQGKIMKNTSPKQDQTLLTLCALFMSRKRATPKELPRVFESDISHLIHGETSTGNALRAASGGELHKVPKNIKEGEQYLFKITESVYPALLIDYKQPPENGANSRYWSYDTYGNPVNREFCNWLRINNEAFKHFSSGNQTPTLYLVHSSGFAGSFQLYTLAEHVIDTAWITALRNKETKDPPTFTDLFSQVKKVFDEVRNGLSTGEYHGIALVGLSGVLLPNSVQAFDVANVRVRRWLQSDTRFSSVLDDRYYCGGSDAGSEGHRFHYRGDIVAEIPITLKVTVPQPPEESSSEERSTELHSLSNELREAINYKVHLVQLALLLSQQSNSPSGRWTWQTIIDPLSNGSSIAFESKSPYINTQGALTLTTDDLENWKIWLERILQHEESLRNCFIGVRHLLSAVNERENPDDRLLDAVVAWENLVGVDHQTTFRVTAALACLQSDEPEVYQERQKQFSKIYNVRSRVIHGSDTADKVEVEFRQTYGEPASEVAIATAVKAYQAALTSHLEILHIRDSETRNHCIIKGKVIESIHNECSHKYEWS